VICDLLHQNHLITVGVGGGQSRSWGRGRSRDWGRGHSRDRGRGRSRDHSIDSLPGRGRGRQMGVAREKKSP